jgi:hypothetical protein
MYKNTIEDVILNGLNSGLAYDISDFILYFMNNHNSEFDRDIERIKKLKLKEHSINQFQDTQIKLVIDGGPGRTRTYDQLIKSQLLYQLSYGPKNKLFTSLFDYYKSI